MPKPPPSDPSHPLYDAAGSMRGFGIALLLFAVYAGGIVWVVGQLVGKTPRWMLGLRVAVCFVPGIAMFVLAAFAIRRHFWALIAGFCIASVVSLGASIGMALIAFLTIRERALGALLGLVGITSAIAVGSGWVALRIARGFAVIRPPASRGFEPIMRQD